ncbi:PHB depolymerase family esterase [Sediminicoccus sp. KRV36]|uniref:extracellular catalytic domain type 1 short-chain-length polyhydroxyalkanoate depolymerase n=1 Tax=Sediminicoccus sp. KRV36 TaxID=3133721 RepID=UPI00200C9243|nr:PHB depolymerase family esterase [Sediminicoccus rosea]UPY38803.1 PHB depolymerase family esterase [Sediminicoccus rosea]
MSRRFKRIALPRARAARRLGAIGVAAQFGKAAVRLMTLAWPAAANPAEPGGVRGRVAEVRDFGSNPGELRMLVYQPRKPPAAGAPLILVLHGCRQDGAAFATQAGWLALSESLGIPLVMPEQAIANNRSRCFNWYRPDDVRRGQGEGMSIRQMVRHAIRRFGSSPRRVFIVGLSAGGAMAAAMLAAYPAVFAGGAVVAGMPVGSASTSPMALLRMHRADPFRTRLGLVASVRARTAPRGQQPWPRLSIWQGEKDRTVDPENAEILATQWSALHGCLEEPTSDTQPAEATRHRVWSRRGAAAVELWTIAGMGHGFPIGAGAGSAGPWVLDVGVPAARHIAAFWGLDGKAATQAPA